MSFILHINSKLDKSHDVKFTIALSKNPEPPPKIDPPVSHQVPHSKKICQRPPIFTKFLK